MKLTSQTKVHQVKESWHANIPFLNTKGKLL